MSLITCRSPLKNVFSRCSNIGVKRTTRKKFSEFQELVVNGATRAYRCSYICVPMIHPLERGASAAGCPLGLPRRRDRAATFGPPENLCLALDARGTERQRATHGDPRNRDARRRPQAMARRVRASALRRGLAGERD